MNKTKLKLIKAALKKYLALVEKTNSGPWEQSPAGSGWLYSPDYSCGGMAIVTTTPVDKKTAVSNALFIEHARTLSPCMAQSLLFAITALEKECSNYNFPDEDRPICYEALCSIIGSWPNEPAI